MLENQRVVVTGLGVISPVGLSASEAWKNVRLGQSGIRRISLFDTGDPVWRVKIAGEAWGFDPRNYLTARETRRADRTTQFALAATAEALEQANLVTSLENSDDVGVVIGCGSGGLWTYAHQHEILLTKGPQRMNPLLIPMEVIDSSGVQISIRYGLHGPNFGLASACSTGADAIGMALEIIKRGDAEVIIAGGTEAAIHPLGIAGFDNMGALSRRNDAPEQASRPFDLERDGFVVGEGAGIVVLESETSARRRGVEPLAEIVSYAGTSDGLHFTAPAASAVQQARAVRRALQKGGVSPDEVGYINGHATGTQVGDPVEILAYRQVFGPALPPISSTKSTTGHMLGAAGAVEAIWTVYSLREQILPPTINYDTPDPNCVLDCIPNRPRAAHLDIAISAAFGFGGHNTVLVFRKWAA
jgi:3-oxoacyl-[acyl-carrier-protein] synthase II